MRRMVPILSLIVIAFVFSGCSKNSSTTLNNSGANSEGVITKDTNSKGVINPTDISVTDFFLADGSKAHYQGEGNEFAELDIEVAHPFKNYVIIYENNGGALVRYIYRIDGDEIVVLANSIVESKTDFPSQKELDAMDPTGIYLKKPFTKGNAFGDWTIVDTEVTVETPYQTFDHAFVIESQAEDIINRKYFVKGFGEVKRESIMKTDDGGEFVVTSTLKAVDQ